MELNEQSLKDIQILIDETSVVLNNNAFYQSLFDILKENLDFLNDVDIKTSELSTATPAYIDNDINTIFYDPKEIYYYSKVLSLGFSNSITPLELEEFLKYLCVVVILHEVAHTYQVACAKDGYSKYKTINEMYNKIYNVSKYNILFRINYALRSISFFHERNANIVAFSNVSKIIPEKFADIIWSNCLYYYLADYGVKKKIITPVRNTYKMLLYKYNLDSSAIPLKERINHGLDLDTFEYDTCIDSFWKNGYVGKDYLVLSKRINEVDLCQKLQK